MVVDTSVVLAIMFQETHGEWAVEQLEKHAGSLVMSTVNLTEALIRIRSKQPERYEILKGLLMNGSIQFIAPDIEQSKIAAKARIQFRINLGDCFVYALAKQMNRPVLSLDSDFGRTDVELLFPSLNH